tara:strand:+ start:15312 stop:15671 length:360 start_codon:yes stop_codon:yes gene_type:complete
MKQNNTNKFKYSEFNTIYPSKPIKLVSSNDSIASMDTFASSAKSDDSLMEIWEKRKLSNEKCENTIPIRSNKNIKRNRETNDYSKSPNVNDAMNILQNTKNLLSNIGLDLKGQSNTIKK